MRWAVFLIICSISGALCQAAPTSPEQNPEEVWLEASINGQQSNDVALYLRTAAGRILAPATQTKAWRLRTPSQAAMTYNNEQYMSLDAIKGLKYHLDEEKQVLVIEAPARLFEQVTLSLSDKSSVRAPRPPLGGFLNYNFVATNASSHTELGGSLEASIFSRMGAGVTEYLLRHGGQQTRAIRLDTTWTVDNPESAHSLRFGDSISGVSAWGGAVRFAGIQWASNYTTRPSLITMPLPGTGGESALPSTVDVYVNNVLRTQSNLPGGPFRIDDVPVITGEGDIRLVVRDLLGRQQVIDQPYYASPELLRAGLHEFSLEGGITRDNFGIASNDYGRPLIAATDRVGLTDRLTGEVHGELLKEQQTVGLSSSALLSSLGVLDVALAGSSSGHGHGELFGLGFQHSADRLSLGAAIQYASRDFVRLGMMPYGQTPRLTSQLFASLGLGHLGSLSVGRTREDFYAAHSLDILSVRDSINAGRLGYLTFSVIRTVAGSSDTTFSISLTHSINARASLSATTTADSTAGSTAELDLQQNLPAGRGMGYRVIADEGAMKAVDGTLDLQTDAGNYEVEARQQSGATLVQVAAAGGVALLDSHIFPSRTIDDSFAVIQVGSESGVRVYRENQLVGQTDTRGYLLVPGLRPYQDNSIRIEQADLPLDIVVDTVQARAVPYFRSGVLVSFPVEHPHGALLSVHLENGNPLPAGALVQVTGVEESFPSGLNGEVYVTGLTEHSELHAEWPDGSCHFSLAYEPGTDPLPRLGPYVCQRTPP
ncbi:MAG TPA: fimbria/pilus outer membrane usher protein [Steroidobacteraceae bacterium]